MKNPKAILFYLFAILLMVSLNVNKRNQSELRQKDKEINRIKQNKKRSIKRLLNDKKMNIYKKQAELINEFSKSMDSMQNEAGSCIFAINNDKGLLSSMAIGSSQDIINMLATAFINDPRLIPSLEMSIQLAKKELSNSPKETKLRKV